MFREGDNVRLAKLIRGGAQYSKLGDLNDPGSLRVGGSEGRDVLDHYHNVIH